MRDLTDRKICPRCGAAKMKRWDELTEDEKLLVEKMPFSEKFRQEQRRKHRFCGRCFYEEIQEFPILA